MNEIMTWLDGVSARLQPYRKRLFLGIFAAWASVIPVSMAALTFENDWVTALLVVIPFLGFNWCAGLYCIAYWFAPGTGPASVDKLRRSHWLIACYGHCFRVFAPAFLLVFFLAPIFFVIWMAVDVIFS